MQLLTYTSNFEPKDAVANLPTEPISGSWDLSLANVLAKVVAFQASNDHEFASNIPHPSHSTLATGSP